MSIDKLDSHRKHGNHHRSIEHVVHVRQAIIYSHDL